MGLHFFPYPNRFQQFSFYYYYYKNLSFSGKKELYNMGYYGDSLFYLKSLSNCILV